MRKKMLSGATLVALCCLAGSLPAQERPKRKPAEGGEYAVEATILASELKLGTGGANGVLWFKSEGGRKFEGRSDLELSLADGSKLKVDSLAFELDADEDARGAEEDLPGLDVAPEKLARALAASDFALLPIRMFQWHRMPYTGQTRIAEKRVAGIGQTVEWTEQRVGAQRMTGLSNDLYFTRSVRRFAPSGLEIHDAILSAEYESQKANEHYVAWSRGWRAIFHPTLARADGTRPEGGLLFLVHAKATRLEWDQKPGAGDPLAAPDEDAKLADQFAVRFVDSLFGVIEKEATGDPFDSPSTTLLERTGMLDQSAAARLVNIGGKKSLATVAPLLIAKGFQVDGAKYKKLWSDADDPAFRLLYAAGARLGGKDDPAYAKEARLALGSKDRSVLRACRVLADALNDPLLAADADAAIQSAQTPQDSQNPKDAR